MNNQADKRVAKTLIGRVHNIIRNSDFTLNNVVFTQNCYDNFKRNMTKIETNGITDSLKMLLNDYTDINNREIVKLLLKPF